MAHEGVDADAVHGLRVVRAQGAERAGGLAPSLSTIEADSRSFGSAAMIARMAMSPRFGGVGTVVMR